MAAKVNASAVKFGYGPSLKAAREWGLYISALRGKTSSGIEEPALFSEPSIFIVRPTVRCTAVPCKPCAPLAPTHGLHTMYV